MRNNLWKRALALWVIWAMCVPMFALGEGGAALPEAALDVVDEALPEAPDEQIVEAPVEEVSGLVLGGAPADDADPAEPSGEAAQATAEDEASLQAEDAVVKLVTSIAIDKEFLCLYAKDKGTLTAIVRPANATNGDVTWSSDQPGVAKVSADGVVTAVKKGVATITAKAKDGSGVKAECKAYVFTKGNITLSEDDIAVRVGESKSLKATVTPADLSKLGVKWASSDKKIAKVSASGKVTAVSEGCAIITATNALDMQVQCEVTVYKSETVVSRIRLSEEALSLEEGTNEKLKATVFPATAKSKTLTWTSSNKKVAKVSSSGKVTAVGPGHAVITAAAKNGVKAECDVIVFSDAALVSYINLSADKLSLEVGKTKKLTTAKVAPDTAKNKSVTWSSSDDAIAQVDADGKVTAVKEGKATITATAADGSGVKADCKVTVLPDSTKVAKIELGATEIALEAGKSQKLKAEVLPTTAKGKTLTWTTSDKKIAKVSSSGKVTAVKEGYAVITAATKNGVEAKCEVIVTSDASSVSYIKLSQEALNLEAKASKKLKATAYPTTAQARTITWKSSDKKIAKVSSSGKVTAVKEGYAVITAATKNGVTAKCEVVVTADPSKVTYIALSDEKLTLEVSKTKKLTAATVAPSTAENKALSWKSSDKKVAKVSASGKITAVKVGKATITATAKDGSGVKATCEVTVVPDSSKVAKIELDATELTLDVGATKKLKATVSPDTAKDKSIKWTSSKKSVAKVSSSGTITAVGKGTATITATAKDGTGVKATCKVKVVIPKAEPTAVILDLTKKTVTLGTDEALKGIQLNATISPEGTDGVLTWSTSDSNVAKVSKTGLVEIAGVGKAVITVATSNGKTADCTLEVVNPKPKATGVTLSKSSISTKWGSDTTKYTLKATVSPEGADSAVTWSTSNSAVAAVSSKGVVTIKGVGEAIITAKAKDGSGVSGTCAVKVDNPAPEPTGVILDQTEKTVTLGVDERSFKLNAIISPKGADSKLTWTTSDANVATVKKDSDDDKAATVSITGTGEATITVETANDKTATCVITVVNPKPNVESIRLDQSAIKAELGSETTSYTLVATLYPIGSEGAVKWESSNTGVAKVSQSGVVTIAGAGEAVITASVKGVDEPAECVVTVTNPAPAATGIILDQTSIQATMGSATTSYTLVATLSPNGAYSPVTWASSNTAVATVNTAGVVTVKGEGTTNITASIPNGKQATCTVTVSPMKATPTSVILNHQSLTISIDSGDRTQQLTATVSPAGANDTLTWTSSDTNVAKVSSAGLVTIVGLGKADITVETINGLTDTCKVSVINPEATVEGVSVSPANVTATLNSDESVQLTATITPKGADSKLTWSSSDTTVATVNSNGLVQFVGVGKATITVKTDNNKKATCAVTVKNSKAPAEDVSLNETTMKVTLKEGASTTYTLIATVTPADADDKVTWSSDNEAVATVDSKGVVTIKSVGNATITAAIPNGKSATCDFDVVNSYAATEVVTLSPTSINATTSGTKTYQLKATVSPSGAEPVSWKSGNTSVATVDKNGLVTIKGAGTTTITATSGDKKATCTVTVTAE